MVEHTIREAGEAGDTRYALAAIAKGAPASASWRAKCGARFQHAVFHKNKEHSNPSLSCPFLISRPTYMSP